MKQDTLFWRGGIAGLLMSSAVFAGEVEVVAVEAQASGNDTYRFSVTLRHDDSGWDHYANRWVVLTTEGQTLGERILHHPHENEQPFTRSLSGVEIPAGISEVIIRGNDSVHGFGGTEKKIKLPGR